MRTTTEPTAVAVQSFEQQLTDLFLKARDSLPRGANGRTEKAPPKHIASTRKMMVQGFCRPFKHLVEVGDEMIDAGVPYTEVNAALERMMRRNEARALDRHQSRERPLQAIAPRVQKEMGELTQAVLRQAYSPDSPDALESVLREAADIPPVLTELTRTVGLSLVRAASRPARHLTLEART